MAFLSAEAANREGIWNSQEMIVRQQLAAIRRSSRVVYCIDKRKIGATAPFLLRKWDEVDCLLSDAQLPLINDNAIPVTKFLGTHGDGAIPDPEAPRQDLPVHYL